MRHNLALILLVILAFSCKEKKRPIQKITDNKEIETEIINRDSINIYGYSIGNGDIRVLKTVYVTDRKGTDIRQHPDSSAIILGTYEYGHKLEVIEFCNNWYGVKYRYTRELNENGRKVERTSWEKVFINVSSTGSFDDISLTDDDLYSNITLVGSEFLTDKKIDSLIRETLRIELIDKTLFDSKMSSKVDFITNKTDMAKQNGQIQLNCENTVKVYTDITDAEEGNKRFDFIGQVEFLNCYIISGSYWESRNYILIDKSSGNEILTLYEYPHFSPTQDNLVSIYSNPYWQTADLELYSIQDFRVSQVLNVSFNNWMPAMENKVAFWSTDGFLYVPVLHSKSFWNSSGSLNRNFQYLRIKIL